MPFAEKFQVYQIPVNNIYLVRFRSEKVIGKLSAFVGGLFSNTNFFFEKKNTVISRNSNQV